MLIIVSPVNTSSVRVEYNSGNIIRPLDKTLNAGHTKLDILLKVPDIQRIITTRLKQPCDHRDSLIEDLQHYNITNPEYSDVIERFHEICKRNSRLRKSSLALRHAYDDNIHVLEDTISQLIPSNRSKRSIFSTIRHVFGIADYDKQQQLQKTVQQLSQTAFRHEGQLIGLNYAVEHVGLRLQKLYESTKTIANATRKISKQLNILTLRMNSDRIIQKYEQFLLTDMLQSGIIQNQVIARYNHILEQRMQAFTSLARGYLPPEIIAPRELEDITTELEDSLSIEHPLLDIVHNSVYQFYTRNNVVSYLHNGSTFIKIPVYINLHEQDFQLYEIDPFPLLIPNSSVEHAMLVQHRDIIALNADMGTHIVMNQGDLHQCHGHQLITCSKLFTQYINNQVETCELSIYNNDIEKMKQYCEIGLKNIQSLKTNVHYITNNKILIINPFRDQFYKMCKRHNRQIALSNEFIFDVKLECFCYVLSDRIVSPIFADEYCANKTVINIHRPTDNILYVSLMLNKSMISLEDFNVTSMLPELQLPDLVNNLELEDDVIDLKRLLYERNNGYANMVNTRLDKHSSMLDNFSVAKLFAYGVPALGFLVFILTFVFLFKTNNLRRLIGLASLIKTSDAAPILKTTREIIEISTDAIILLFAILAIVYLLLRYFKTFQKFKNYLTIPFNSCITVKNTPRIEVILYIESFKNHCMIYIDSLTYTKSSDIKVNINEQPLNPTLHCGCLTNYITFNKEIKLELHNEGNHVYRLPNALQIPFYLKDQVASILNENHTCFILVGTSGIYFHHKLN